MKAIRHIILSVAVILAATDFSFSQSYSITPNDTFELTGYMEDLQTLTISQLNITNDSVFLKWKKVSTSVPADWEATICDNRVCYTELVDSGFMNPVLPAETGFLLLHITAHANYGTAIIRYEVWDVSNPSARDTVTFIMTVNQPSAINEAENKSRFNIFPNPVNDDLNVILATDKNFTVNIFNSVGEKVCSTVSSHYSLLTTHYLPNGPYTLTISENTKSTLTKKIIVQH